MKLGKYFTLEEMIASDTAKARKIDNTPDSTQIAHLKMLVENVLDPLREAWGKPLHVNSGYRCPDLNRAIGGAKTSDHMYGNAADITTIHSNRSERIRMNRQLFDLCEKMNIPFKQLIDESGYTWVHISFSPYSLKHEVKHL
ncbi:MAG: D-Ala-D-Ala carboxypeptidase family metallohydrolase [Paludibacteraceae bacterium]|nr:D-Ala-D-Ala carboxypeptidase family metallohydrolase [Paludibacteraceae bacterium]